MNILITNDDGIYSEGIQVLAKEISKISQVTVVAPDRERSATAHAITMHKPLRVEKIDYSDCTNITCYMVNGTPSDCVKLGIEALLSTPPDFVLSGINNGLNLGTDTIYSGTVSAAIEASMGGFPALAFSLERNKNLNYSFLAHFAKNLCLKLNTLEFPEDLLLNINAPSNSRDIQGVYITHLGRRRYKNSFHKRKDPRGREYFWLAGEVIENTDDTDSDIWAIKNNYISITPVHFDLTKYDFIDVLKRWDLNFKER